MGKQISIRPACEEDSSTLTLFIEKLGYHLDQNKLTEKIENYNSYNGYGIIVAEYDKVVIGFLAWSKAEIFLKEQTRFHIEAIFIDEHYRSMGAAKQLINYLENYAFHFRPAVIDLNSGVRRESEGIYDFYRKIGFSEGGHYAKKYFRKEVL